METPTREVTNLGSALGMLSGVLYLICLATPAYHPVIGYAEAGVYFGWAALLLGPIGLFGGHFSWLANPLLWCAWVTFWRKSYAAALLLSIVSAAMALTFLLPASIPVGSSGNFPYEILYGYYIWLGSIAMSAAAAAACLRAHSPRVAQGAP